MASPSPNRGAHDNNHLNDNNNKSATSSDTVHDSKQDGSPSSGGGAAPRVWEPPTPRFKIGLTQKEKEEDFLAIKGSKLPLKPKKRAKFIQRSLNHVTPGAILGKVSYKRYEVREKEEPRKKPRGLKGLWSNYYDSDSDKGKGCSCE